MHALPMDSFNTKTHTRHVVQQRDVTDAASGDPRSQLELVVDPGLLNTYATQRHKGNMAHLAANLAVHVLIWNLCELRTLYGR